MKTPKIIGLLLLAALFIAGCQSPNKSHVLKGVGTGTSLGINQNPGTGAYELGFKRAQVEFTSVPIFFTNGVYLTPDVVSRYEVSSHSAVFGNVSLTSTLATGTNAVNTLLGGAAPPINAGVGTGSNLTPLSH